MPVLPGEIRDQNISTELSAVTCADQRSRKMYAEEMGTLFFVLRSRFCGLLAVLIYFCHFIMMNAKEW